MNENQTVMIVLYVLIGILAIWLFCKFINILKLVLKMCNPPLKLHDSSPEDYTITSEVYFNMLKQTMSITFGESVVNSSYDKVYDLINDWKYGDYPDFRGYICKLADYLETCPTVDWHAYHLNMDALVNALSNLPRNSTPEMHQKAVILQRIYNCLKQELTRHDFRE